MSKKTEAKASSQPTARATAAADPKGQGQTTAHDLDTAKDMLTHKKRGDALLREDEREELMMNKLDQDGRSDQTSLDKETESSGLSGKDTWNFALLVVLYLLQGVPVGLTFGSIPFLLKAKMSYSQIGIFSLAHYPYSMKFLWSPIVDAVYNKDMGRRKSWIVPIQLLTGVMFLWLGMNIEGWMAQDQIAVGTLTVVFFALIFFCATQDIAVDGWALTLLSKENLSYASTAQTIGLNTGYFLSFTVFLAFNSAEFSNKYFRSEPLDYGLVPLGGYLKFWAMMYLAITLWLIFMKKEDRPPADEEDIDIKSVYKIILRIIRLPHMKSFMVVLLTAKIGFIANDAVTALKLLEKGFSKEDLALAVLIDFPFQIIFGYYAVRWSSGERPLKPWLWAFFAHLACCVIAMLLVWGFPADGVVTPAYFYMVLATTVATSFTSTVAFVSMGAFMTVIADPLIGGTYMTLLNTLSNFGGTWPRFFVLEAVDYFTVSTCSLVDSKGQDFSCASEPGKGMCEDLGGECILKQDGYFFVSSMCVLVGGLLLVLYIAPTIRYLESLSPKKWKLEQKH
ncbi:MFS transporter, PAT family, solute carrier family 33 (acetyl-CoA transportor), member 1 [Entomortierella parvispora]|uniref:MFS transporter, PAT family, solute carrier family 33 (Acetyl-CoA transportor), member 1 n=1 Tax=Entomortierella parvispora TaxID=205924 RepID=A0A9P3H6V5_9FUNG|nr:MFS transporter, PAT family, solute carrier family 33 (acetyl-CoA transportor), member 1 [Entomortierella parvispora]